MPMAQGIITDIKLNIHTHIHKDYQVGTLYEEDQANPLANPMPTFYKTMNIYDCLHYIAIEWELLMKTTMVNCWQKMFDLKQLKGLSAS